MSGEKRPGGGSLFDSSALLKTFQGAASSTAPGAGPSLTAVPSRPEIGPGDLPTFAEAAWVSPQPTEETAAVVLSGRNAVAEEFRILLAKIRILSEKQPLGCIGIVSAVPGEGKTTVALGLAAALARQPGRRVLLVECDLRKPAAERYLGLPRETGVAEWLAGASEPVALRRVVPPGFLLLSAGRGDLERPDLLGSRRMAGLLEGARRAFDIVLVDCPPITPVSDSVLLQDMLDGFLFVVRSRTSPREAILRGISRLRPGAVRGVVLNDQREIVPRYHTSGYRRYGADR
jgi:Mrp family chromosome partitioning ATPase